MTDMFHSVAALFRSGMAYIAQWRHLQDLAVTAPPDTLNYPDMALTDCHQHMDLTL
jgi:hypothetical protein